MTFLDRIKETSTSTGTGTFTLAGAVLGYKVFSNGTYKYCIVNDTESEWEVGEGTVASGVLTRTTIEASSNGGAAVSFSAGTKQVFNTVSAAYVNSLVPYTGATASVNLGEYGLTAGQLTLDTSPTGTAVVGTTRWNDTIGSSETLLKGGNVLLKNGVDLVARVVNKVTPATTLTKAAYKAVRVSGAQGQRLAIAYAQANNDNNSADTIGLVCETIAQNQEGFIITVGQLLDVNTTGSLQGETWADGDVLYLSPTTAGNLTNIKPTGATGHIVIIGYVEYAHANNGKIYVKVMNGWELTELHDTYISSVANNDVLVYESSTTLWKNKSIATILGYTPQAAITLTTTGTSGAATFVGNTLNIPQYASGISGSGTAGQVTYWTGTSAVGGSSNLFWDDTNARLGIGTSSPANTLQIKGAGTTSSTTSLLIQDSANNHLFSVNDIGHITVSSNQQSKQARFYVNGYTTYPFINASSTGVVFSSANNNNLSLQGNPIQFYNGSGSTELMRIFATGNLMLQNGGTFTDSGYRLDINGTGASTGALRVTGGNVQFGSATGLNWDNTNSRLGIGTNAPQKELHIYTAGTNEGAGFRVTPSQSGGVAAIQFTNTSNVFRGSLGYWDTGNGVFPNRLVLYAPSQTASFTIYTGSTSHSFDTATGNVALGSASHLGTRLGVVGDTLLRGSGNTSATNALTVQDSGSTNTFRVRNDGGLVIGNSSLAQIFPTTDGTTVNTGAQTISIVGGTGGYPSIFLGRVAAVTNTFAGTQELVRIIGNFTPTSGSHNFEQLRLQSTINQTGGANGITRGLYVNPTLTAAADFRAIETTNGKIVFGNLPTSSAGLPTGALWNNTGVINIV